MKSKFMPTQWVRIFGWLNTWGLLLVATCAPAQKTNVLSAFGAARVDGIFSAGEWDNAATVDLTINLPGEGTTSGTIYVMNDQTNLYLALRLERSVVDQAVTVAFAFNNGDSGTSLGAGDDAILLDVFGGTDQVFFDIFYYTNSSCPPFTLCSDYDVNAGGSNDGEGGFSNDGTYSYFELSHPLNIGDPHDFSLVPGQTVLCWPFVRLLDSTDYGDTTPGGMSLLIASPPNHPPTAEIVILSPFVSIDSSSPIIVAVRSPEATLILDGSLSSDLDSDRLNFHWYEGQETIGAGPVLTNGYALGAHTVGLRVSDSAATSDTSLNFEVLTPDQTVELLMRFVQSSSVARRAERPLLGVLEAAAASFQRGHRLPALNELRAFQSKVRAQVAPASPAYAQQLIDIAQQIIRAVADSLDDRLEKPPRNSGRCQRVW
jgi:hypothetical protein